MNKPLLNHFPQRVDGWVQEFFDLLTKSYNSRRIDHELFSEIIDINIAELCLPQNSANTENFPELVGDFLADSYILYLMKPTTVAEHKVFIREFKCEELLRKKKGPTRQPMAREKFEYSTNLITIQYMEDVLAIADRYSAKTHEAKLKFPSSVRIFRSLFEVIRISFQQPRKEYLVDEILDSSVNVEELRMQKHGKNFCINQV